MRRRTPLALALLAVATLGCGDVGKRVFTPPAVAFRGVRVGQVGLDGARLDVTLELRNPNGYGLTARGGHYRLYAGDDSTLVGEGTTSDTVHLAAHDSAAVRLPVDVRWDALRSAGIGALARGSTPYRIAGEVNVATPVGTYAVPVDARGTARVALPRF